MLLSIGRWVSPQEDCWLEGHCHLPSLKVTEQTSKTESSLKTGENEICRAELPAGLGKKW